MGVEPAWCPSGSSGRVPLGVVLVRFLESCYLRGFPSQQEKGAGQPARPCRVPAHWQWQWGVETGLGSSSALGCRPLFTLTDQRTGMR
jgi:hypothetical protein